ncbi:MOSC domain-containing protein [Nocardia sp. NEAU-351]|uniref:MOSC domain-containing protein n=1 Tax=Nocardia bovistercoris TaxID=2785916 RepID=A0A931N6J8_9NOCA|nr:MOSC domain-containing protein [Nocardia bovistercoris]
MAPNETSTGRVLAVCTVHADLEVPGRVGRTAIDKRPRAGRVPVRVLGLDADHVCNTEHHGGRDQAVYAYAEHDARRWGAELGRELPAGWFGENLRIEGLEVSDAVLGARWAIGDTLLEVSAPRVPCATFGHWSGEPQWVKRFTQRGDTGAYLRVLTEGSIGAGDRVEIVYTPAHGVTVRDLFDGNDMDLLTRLLAEEPTVSGDVRIHYDRHAHRHASAERAARQRAGSRPHVSRTDATATPLESGPPTPRTDTAAPPLETTPLETPLPETPLPGPRHEAAPTRQRAAAVVPEAASVSIADGGSVSPASGGQDVATETNR